MGPLASAEFIKTIYELNADGCEQQAPVCVLMSDPTFPDRTQSVLDGESDAITSRLEQSVRQLLDQGCSHVVVACITAHHFLEQLSPTVRSRIISLLDVLFEELLDSQTPHVLLCTNGTRRARILQRDLRWTEAAPNVVLLDDQDQVATHELIYRIKVNQSGSCPDEFLQYLAVKYGTTSFVAGCTEVHLLNKQLVNRGSHDARYRFIDPLMKLARDFRSIICE